MTAPFSPRDPDYAERVRRSFGKQGMMRTIGAVLARIEPGEVEVVLTASPGVTQQHGFVHGGALASAADSACGYAALTLMAPSAGVLAVEFKLNFLAPAAATRIVAIGRVVRPGRTLIVAQGEVFGEKDGEERALVALMTATFMTVEGREGVLD